MSSEVADAKNNDAATAVNENNQHDAAEAKGKKGLVKKLSALERTTQEGEALLKEMGYKEDGEDQGRRRTRSGARPAPVATPPPAKKEKKAPKTPTTPTSGRRGRPPKKSITDSSTENEEAEMKEEARTEAKTEEAKEESKPVEAAKEEKNEEKQTEKENKKENNEASEPTKEKENHSEKNDSETTEESKASD